MSTSISLPTLPDIGLTGATYLGLGLAAVRDGDEVRAIEAFASIDSAAWEAIAMRFPNLSALVERLGATR